MYGDYSYLLFSVYLPVSFFLSSSIAPSSLAISTLSQWTYRMVKKKKKIKQNKKIRSVCTALLVQSFLLYFFYYYYFFLKTQFHHFICWFFFGALIRLVQNSIKIRSNPQITINAIDFAPDTKNRLCIFYNTMGPPHLCTSVIYWNWWRR